MSKRKSVTGGVKKVTLYYRAVRNYMMNLGASLNSNGGFFYVTCFFSRCQSYLMTNNCPVFHSLHTNRIEGWAHASDWPRGCQSQLPKFWVLHIAGGRKVAVFIEQGRTR